MKLAVADSVSFGIGLDAFDALAFAIANDFRSIQYYLSPSLSKDRQKILRLARESFDANIEIICHGPSPLNDLPPTPDLITAVKDLFSFQKDPALLLHHDPSCDIDSALSTAKLIADSGVSILLENFYPKTINPDLAIASYIELLRKAESALVPLTPVFDIPRLFIRWIANDHDPMQLSKRLIDGISGSGKSIVLHMIDSSSADQDRPSWRPIGMGSIPYDEILSYIEHSGIKVSTAVLEYEDKASALESRAYFDRTNEVPRNI